MDLFYTVHVMSLLYCLCGKVCSLGAMQGAFALKVGQLSPRPHCMGELVSERVKRPHKELIWLVVFV